MKQSLVRKDLYYAKCFSLDTQRGWKMCDITSGERLRVFVDGLFGIDRAAAM